MIIPLDVPTPMHRTFKDNYNAITKNSEHLLLFAFDHKIEHGDAVNPGQVFSLAAQTEIGAFATQFGLITRYGKQFPTINYIVKLNGKTNLLSNHDPISRTLWNVESVVELRESAKLNIRGIGYTIYLGSEHESNMMAEAAYHISQAHQNGLLAFLWIYPRGTSIRDELDLNVITKAAGVGVCLGADFVKVKAPHYTTTEEYNAAIKQIAQSAGNTKVIFSGGEKEQPVSLIKRISEQMQTKMIAGNAIGRNFYQNDTATAVALMIALKKLIYDQVSYEKVLDVFEKHSK